MEGLIGLDEVGSGWFIIMFYLHLNSSMVLSGQLVALDRMFLITLVLTVEFLQYIKEVMFKPRLKPTRSEIFLGKAPRMETKASESAGKAH
ncbi:hypothetical protein TELCIR_23739 [Teladorsagia circumcincta]|uniref:Uncharacterized protein n=1 Tax=Teladorsagia circumcincta TaxID=45464 RepID=A0A2G9TA90_TELCI|nr:hypothetical protein TELCIR_23739 [Teladorsagia circumcincta]